MVSQGSTIIPRMYVHKKRQKMKKKSKQYQMFIQFG